MSVDLFTVADHAALAAWHITDVPAPRPRSVWTVKRLLEAAADGTLLGSDTADPDEPHEDSLSIDGRELTEDESRVLIELIADGQLTWIGVRIALTAAGRELLVRYQRIGGEQA